jgi:hypothetical protein
LVSGVPKTKALISASVTERRPVSGGREDLEDRLLSVVEDVKVVVGEGEVEVGEDADKGKEKVGEAESQ